MEQIKTPVFGNGAVMVSSEKPTPEQHDKLRVEWYNQMPGNLTGYDCKACRNKGYIAVLDEGVEKHLECKCLKIRRCLQNIRNSGLSDALHRMTFENYQCNEAWQDQAKTTAQNYAKNTGNSWLYISGQSGAGKRTFARQCVVY